MTEYFQNLSYGKFIRNKDHGIFGAAPHETYFLC